MAKLFNIVEPDVAVFGKKDYQQWRVICRMVRDLDFDVEVVGVATGREEDGMAMSSRNALLTPDNRQRAVCISQALKVSPRHSCNTIPFHCLAFHSRKLGAAVLVKLTGAACLPFHCLLTHYGRIHAQFMTHRSDTSDDLVCQE